MQLLKFDQMRSTYSDRSPMWMNLMLPRLSSVRSFSICQCACATQDDSPRCRGRHVEKDTNQSESWRVKEALIQRARGRNIDLAAATVSSVVPLSRRSARARRATHARDQLIANVLPIEKR